jgi:hypothetical protein
VEPDKSSLLGPWETEGGQVTERGQRAVGLHMSRTHSPWRYSEPSDPTRDDAEPRPPQRQTSETESTPPGTALPGRLRRVSNPCPFSSLLALASARRPATFHEMLPRLRAILSDLRARLEKLYGEGVPWT